MDKIQVNKHTYRLMQDRIQDRKLDIQIFMNKKTEFENELEGLQADLDRFEIKEGV